MSTAISRTDSALRLRQLRVRYGDKAPVLDVESLDVAAGEIVAVVGPSGAGKTTLLRLANGYVRAAAGDLDVLGHATSFGPGTRPQRRDRRQRQRVGFVFQRFNVVERATVFDNVLWGSLGRLGGLRPFLGRFPEAERRAAMAAIVEVDLLEQTTQRVDTLSGGQQQRVGVARVIVQSPELVLADEPVSSLDPVLAVEIVELLVGVARRRDTTLVMSVHVPELARRFADRIVGLNAGRVVWDGAAAQFDAAAIGAIYGTETPPAPLETGI